MTPREGRAAALAYRVPVKLSADGPRPLAAWVAQICLTVPLKLQARSQNTQAAKRSQLPRGWTTERSRP